MNRLNKTEPKFLPCLRFRNWPILRLSIQYIEDIYFFEVNIKYIASSVMKTSEFSRVRRTTENFDVFNSRDGIYLVFTKKSKLSFYFILLEDLRLIN